MRKFISGVKGTRYQETSQKVWNIAAVVAAVLFVVAVYFTTFKTTILQ